MKRRSIHNRMDDIQGKLPPKPESICDVITAVLLMHQERDEVRLSANQPTERPEGYELLNPAEMRAWVREFLDRARRQPRRAVLVESS